MIPSLPQLVRDWLSTQRTATSGPFRGRWDVVLGPFERHALHFANFKFSGYVGDFMDDGIDMLARPLVSRQKLQATDPQFFEKLRCIMNTVEELYYSNDLP
jgi:hypothetical protein